MISGGILDDTQNDMGQMTGEAGDIFICHGFMIPTALTCLGVIIQSEAMIQMG